MERTELRSAVHPGLFTDDQKLVNDKLGDEIVKWRITILFALLLTCGCMSSRIGPTPSLSIRLTGTDKTGDEVTVSTEGSRTVIDVRSKSGIGRAEISPADGKWQRPLIMRLHLNGLESLSVNNGKFAVDTSVLSRPPYRQLCELFPVGGRKGSSLEDVSPLWFPVRIVNNEKPEHRVVPLDNGHFEVTFPDAMFDGSPKTISIQWIDFFRR